MRRLSITKIAQADIVNLVGYVAAKRPVASGQFRDELRAKFTQLLEMPGLGFPVRGSSSNLRATRISPRFWRYLIYYRESDEMIEIVRVLHASRDLRKLFKLR